LSRAPGVLHLSVKLPCDTVAHLFSSTGSYIWVHSLISYLKVMASSLAKRYIIRVQGAQDSRVQVIVI